MINSTRFASVCVLLVLTMTLLFVAALPASAADIQVTYSCTLEDAIEAANNNEGEGGCEAGTGSRDTIILTNSVSVGKNLPEITSRITIDGSGRSITFGDRPAFILDGGTLILKNASIRFRQLRSDTLVHVTDGELTLENSSFHDCTGGMDAEDSSIALLGNSAVCGHSREIVLAWFGIVPPQPHTCETLSGAAVTATYGLASGLQCNQVGASGIGIQSVIDAGFIDAVDVWGYVEQGIEICFPQLGSLTFLDAATSPRTVSTAHSYSKGGQTCTSLTRAGTVVLVPGAPSAAGPATAAQPVTTTTIATETVVSGCPITATGHLKFFASPSSDAEIIGYITRGTTMSVVSRKVGWYQVSHNGQTAWVGGKYTAGGSSC